MVCLAVARARAHRPYVPSTATRFTYPVPTLRSASPWLQHGDRASINGDAQDADGATASLSMQGVDAPRRTLAYFSGNLAHNEPIKYARGIRHRLVRAFGRTAGWRLVGKAGAAYSSHLASSEFCIVPPGGDGWSSRVDDSVRASARPSASPCGCPCSCACAGGARVRSTLAHPSCTPARRCGMAASP